MTISEVRTVVTGFLAYMEAYVGDGGAAELQCRHYYGKRWQEVVAGVIEAMIGQEWFAGSAHHAAQRYLQGNCCAREVMVRICQVVVLDNLYQEWQRVATEMAAEDPVRATKGHQCVLDQLFMDALEEVTVAEASVALLTPCGYWYMCGFVPRWQHILHTAAWDGQLADQIREVLVLFGLINEAGEHKISYHSLT